MRRLVSVLVLAVGAATAADARWPSEAPPLPPPDPEVFDIVNVDTAQELADACWDLASNQAIVIAPGTYDLSDVVFPNGVDCSRGVALGLVSSQDHDGGVVRNNFFRWNPDAAYQVDVPIYTTSPGSAILHNSVLTHGLYDAAVEVRFAGATGVEVRGNLLDGIVRPRDGAAPLVADNITDADPAWFADEAAGDLHLLPTAAAAIDQLDPLSGCSDDFDGDARPVAPGTIDVGADELEGPLFADGFESGDTTAWSATVPG
jgi:hypothetical protein